MNLDVNVFNENIAAVAILLFIVVLSLCGVVVVGVVSQSHSSTVVRCQQPRFSAEFSVEIMETNKRQINRAGETLASTRNSY